MSIKIYNGFKFASTDLFEINAFLLRVRDQINKKATEQYLETITRQTVTEFDSVLCKTGKYPDCVISTIRNRFDDRQRENEKNGYADPQTDFSFDVVVLPFEGAVYGIVFAGQHEWTKWFMRLKEVSNFSYWDNTDGPTGVSVANWDKRGDIWKRLIAQDQYSRPGQCGMGMKVLPFIYLDDINKILRRQPSFEKRVATTAKSIVYHAKLAEDADKSFDNIMRRVSLGSKWLETEHGKALIEAEAVRVAGILPQRITKEMLMHRPS